MLISIHDVPRYERHLLFCSKLDPRKPRRRRRRARMEPAPDDQPGECAPDAPHLALFAAGFDAAGMTLGVA